MSIHSEFSSYYSEIKGDIDTKLESFVDNLTDFRLHTNIEYCVNQDKSRMKPIVLILCNHSLGGSMDYIKPLSIAFEFMHTAEMIHEDIIMNSSHRIENSIVREEWNPIESVLTAETLIAIAMNIASRYDRRVTRQVSDYSMRLASGHSMVGEIGLDTPINEYINIVAEKTSLFRTAGYCAAVATECEKELDLMKVTKSAKKFGIAYQIYKDLLYIESGGSKKPKITLPVLHCYHSMNSEDKKGMKQDINILKMEDSSFTAMRMRRNLEKHGSMSFCKEKADHYFRDSIKLLRIFNEDSADKLEQIIDHIRNEYKNHD